ncbi:unnamed protein product [Cylindrotheca closterium]|uniref:Uncharacterized protein n=1 Tax=Cylindrotheca closterium TaxID=2856 RepID=A0AAD2CQV5_9STRA|nr:unnamed protein product [Cylindrotheca closterium]
MIIDKELRKKQVWVASQMKTAEQSSTITYFPALPETHLDWLEVGDAPLEWNGENPPNTSGQKEASKKKREKEDAQKKALNQPKKWFEFSNAIGGSWLKASTGPPNPDAPLHLLLVRDGRVVDVVKTTVARYKSIPEYFLFARGPGWGIDIPSIVGHQNSLFHDAQIGDCALLQIQPYHMLHEDFKASLSDFYTIETPDDNHHKGLVDLDVVKSQIKICAIQKTSPTSRTTVCFEPLSEIKTEVKVGDKLWPSNPSFDGSIWKKRDETFRQRDHQRVLGSADDELKQRIEELEELLQHNKDIRDIPGRREEFQDEIRKKHPYVWSDTNVAMNGSWIKACTWPPQGDMPVDMLLLRDEQVVEIISTTLSKLDIFGPYNHGEYSGEKSMVGSHPGWAINVMTASCVFSGGLEIGDCVMLKVPPLTCEGGKIVT